MQNPALTWAILGIIWGAMLWWYGRSHGIELEKRRQAEAPPPMPRPVPPPPPPPPPPMFAPREMTADRLEVLKDLKKMGLPEDMVLRELQFAPDADVSAMRAGVLRRLIQ